MKILKNILGVYEGEMDKENNMSIDDIFDTLKTLIKNTSPITIPEQSNFFENLDNYIYPYMKTVMQLYIPELRNQLENYQRYLMNESRIIEIISILMKSK